MNKYLEKIAVKVSTMDKARKGADVYSLHQMVTKKKKKKPKLVVKPRLRSHGTVRKNT